MDIEEISGPKIRSTILLPANPDEPKPVEEKASLSHIRERTSPYEDLDRWDIEDRVTISAEARRKYREMLSARDNNSLAL